VSEPGSLEAAIDRLYAAFAHMPRPAKIDYCPHCFTEDEERALLAPVELRQIPIDVLRPYAADVMLTVGGIDDLRYFLPRILEIACTVEFQWPDLEPVASRLRIAGWQDWPATETAAVRGVLQALWATTLATFPSTLDIETVLCAIGNAEDDVDPYLISWAAALHDPPAAAHLRELLHGGARWDQHIAGWRLRDEFWDGRDSQVATWLAGPDLRRAVADAITTVDAEQTLQVLEGIDDMLRSPDT
jgi:hypothetical protein